MGNQKAAYRRGVSVARSGVALVPALSPERSEPDWPTPASVCQPFGLTKNTTGIDITEEARERLLSVRGEPLFIADWVRVLMIHYEVDAKALQRVVPFELELYDGRAFVTVVAFTLRAMRPRLGGRFSAWLMKPIATHEFLNVRTYVRQREESGIYFMTEWLSNRLSVALGPVLFGLPYRYGCVAYETGAECGIRSAESDQRTERKGETTILRGHVEDAAGNGMLSYRATLDSRPKFLPCDSGTLTEWLMERYTAFTCHKNVRRFFRVWHLPWEQQSVEVRVDDQSLLERHWPFMREAIIVGANYSPGVRDVWMGRPHWS